MFFVVNSSFIKVISFIELIRIVDRIKLILFEIK